MIAIDFVSTSQPSGSKTYIINFCQELFNDSATDRQISVYVLRSFLKDITINNKPKNIKIIEKSDLYSNSILRLIWIQFILPFNILLNRSKILYSPMNIAPLILKYFKVKNILTLHSNLPWVNFKLMPGSFIKKYLIKFFMTHSIKNCDYLIVNSNYAKKEIISKLNLNEKKVIKIYLGIDANIKKNSKSDESKKNDYILSILSCVRYHNIINLINGYEIFLRKSNKKLKLKIIMQILDKGYYNEIYSYIKKNNLENFIEIISSKNRSQLESYYRNANCYIFTSYCEVFGYSTLEAMNFKLPVLTSNRSALKEINGDAAVYFDPDNIEEISNKLLDICFNNELRDYLKLKGSENLKRFKSGSNFRQTMDFIYNISDKSHHKI